jgi:putative acyl-CoA dehydrogenase
MQNVLADLCVESEAATLLAARLAHAYDEGFEPAGFRRAATAVAKYWVCKRAPAVAAEALECLGGNGFVEESPMPRLLRDSPLNSIWEGSGNVIALDVLRAASKDGAALGAVLAEIRLAAGADPRLDRAAAAAAEDVRWAAAADPADAARGARRLVESLAVALQASLVVRHSPPAVAEAFLASRVTGDRGLAFGTLPTEVDAEAIIERHRPRLAAG